MGRLYNYLVHFEQVAAWNRWNNQEKAQQLMCLRGNAQNILIDLTFNSIMFVPVTYVPDS